MRTFALVCLFTVLPLGMLGACGSEGEDSPPAALDLGGGGLGGGHTIIDVGACDGDEGLEKECTIYIEQASGVTSCFTGFQYCSAGRWTECLDPDHDPRVL